MAQREKSEIDQLLEEFRKIGRDSEYCPESEEVIAKDIIPRQQDECFKAQYLSLYAEWVAFMQGITSKTVPASYGSSVKFGSWICTFCRKNGEAYSFYTSHRLRDELDRICCPILYNYVCPICEATAENAHTLKYCPYNKDQESIPLITRLKGLRNSMGKRRGRYSY